MCKDPGPRIDPCWQFGGKASLKSGDKQNKESSLKSQRGQSGLE